jgi:hypothetical protein
MKELNELLGDINKKTISPIPKDSSKHQFFSEHSTPSKKDLSNIVSHLGTFHNFTFLDKGHISSKGRYSPLKIEGIQYKPTKLRQTFQKKNSAYCEEDEKKNQLRQSFLEMYKIATPKRQEPSSLRSSSVAIQMMKRKLDETRRSTMETL